MVYILPSSIKIPNFLTHLTSLSISAGCSSSTRKPRPTSPTGQTWAPALKMWTSKGRRLLPQSVWVWPRSTTSTPPCWSSASCTPSSWELTRRTSRWVVRHWHHAHQDVKCAKTKLHSYGHNVHKMEAPLTDLTCAYFYAREELDLRTNYARVLEKYNILSNPLKLSYSFKNVLSAN